MMTHVDNIIPTVKLNLRSDACIQIKGTNTVPHTVTALAVAKNDNKKLKFRFIYGLQR